MCKSYKICEIAKYCDSEPIFHQNIQIDMMVCKLRRNR